MEPNKKKIVDLGILETDEVSGVKKISLVEEPAIMLDFHYFNTQKFVHPNAGETQEEFIGRCIPVLIGEGKDQDQAAAVCYAYWDEKMEIDTAGLPQYVDQIPKKKKDIVTRAILAEKACDMDYEWSKDDYIVETIIGVAKELGVKEADLNTLFAQKFATANPNGVSDGDILAAVLSDPKNELRLYKYEGRISSNSRSFCEQMVQLDLYYTEEAIKAMSDVAYNPGFGPRGADTYSIWDFKGGARCQHFWSKFNVYQKVNGDIKVQRVGPVAGKAGRRPDDMRNHGYLEARHSASFNFASEEQQILVGPAMVPNMKILRIDESGQKYWVKFSPETIKEIALKYFKEGRVHELNTDHSENNAGAYIFESWIVETPDDKANTLYGYNLPIGSWCISVKIEDPETWRRVKAGELKGFSIEGILVDMEELEAAKTYERIKKILDK
jgi:Putative phage serine protease XkdF